MVEWKCPQCKRKVKDFPALSRKDNKTKICSSCGEAEALMAMLTHGDFK